MDAVIAWVTAHWKEGGVAVAVLLAVWGNRAAIKAWLANLAGVTAKAKVEVAEFKADLKESKGDPAKVVQSFLDLHDGLDKAGVDDAVSDLIKLCPAVIAAYKKAKSSKQEPPKQEAAS